MNYDELDIENEVNSLVTAVEKEIIVRRQSVNRWRYVSLR